MNKKQEPTAGHENASSGYRCFEDREIKALLMQFAKARGSNGFTKDEFVGLLDYAYRVRMENDLLEIIIAGEFMCDWDGKELIVVNKQPSS
jgi:hypothetical protein